MCTYLCTKKIKPLKNQGFQAEEEGLEPPLTVLETAALPLYYSSIYSVSLTAKVDYNIVYCNNASYFFFAFYIPIFT